MADVLPESVPPDVLAACDGCLTCATLVSLASSIAQTLGPPIAAVAVLVIQENGDTHWQPLVRAGDEPGLVAIRAMLAAMKLTIARAAQLGGVDA